MRAVPGVYRLRIRLGRPAMLTVGAIGGFHFPAGWYVYTGSARNGLGQRIRRHLRRQKRQHWHIDDLLAVVDKVEAFVLPGTAVTECELHAALTGGDVVVPGFGSSDCRCASHLAYFGCRPQIGLLLWKQFVSFPTGDGQPSGDMASSFFTEARPLMSRTTGSRIQFTQFGSAGPPAPP